MVQKKLTPKKKSTTQKKFIPQKLKVLITICVRNKGSFYMDLIENMGVNLQMQLNGEGSAPHNLDNLWGLAHKERDVIISFVPEDKLKKILKMLDDKFETTRHGSGIAFCIPVSSIIGVTAYQFLVDNRKKGKRS